MMKVYICPSCGWMRVVSRRKDVECYKCSEPQMVLAKWISVSTRKCQKRKGKIIPMDGFTSIRRSIEHMKITAEGYQRGALSEALRSEGVFHPAAEDGIGKCAV